MTALDYPVVAQPDGIKLKPEKMVIDQFYKDQDELLHCYEVQDPTVTKEISENPEDIEKILEKYSQSGQIG